MAIKMLNHLAMCDLQMLQVGRVDSIVIYLLMTLKNT